jgi:fluoride ion exporter CrcB/FEX
MLVNSLAVAAGGALGSLARFWLAELCLRLGLTSFPWATLIANVSASVCRLNDEKVV